MGALWHQMTLGCGFRQSALESFVSCQHRRGQLAPIGRRPATTPYVGTPPCLCIWVLFAAYCHGWPSGWTRVSKCVFSRLPGEQLQGSGFIWKHEEEGKQFRKGLSPGWATCQKIDVVDEVRALLPEDGGTDAPPGNLKLPAGRDVVECERMSFTQPCFSRWRFWGRALKDLSLCHCLQALIPWGTTSWTVLLSLNSSSTLRNQKKRIFPQTEVPFTSIPSFDGSRLSCDRLMSCDTCMWVLGPPSTKVAGASNPGFS